MVNIRYLLSLLACACAAAASILPDSTRTALIEKLPPPPVAGSPADLADLETVVQVQADRTPAQVVRATRVANHSAFMMGAAAFGPWFTPQNLPRTAQIFDQIDSELVPVIKLAKKRWHRPRPFIRDTAVQPCVARPPDSSYPSVHSASSAIWAALFTAAFPERRTIFEQEVRETMWCRVLGGVHYPSDTQAGRALGAALARETLDQPAIRALIAEFREEVRIRAQIESAAGDHPAALPQ